MPICRLCPRGCGAERSDFFGGGVCGAGCRPAVARAALHFGEEPCVSGTRGSGTIFFCGCALGCVFCQNVEISRAMTFGRALTTDELGDIFASLRAQGAHNINLVTGSHFIPALAEAIRKHPPGIPVVFNCGGYETPEALRLLEGLVDVYLPDYKFGDAETARLLAAAPDYPTIALDAIREMRRQTGEALFDGGGLMIRGTHVRHLVLPGLTGASMRALTALRQALPRDVRISLMGQYTPCGGAKEIKGMDRPLLRREYERVAAHARVLGFEGYMQMPEASGTEMIPLWDGTGL